MSMYDEREQQKPYEIRNTRVVMTMARWNWVDGCLMTITRTKNNDHDG